MKNGVGLYEINPNVVCVKCGNRGAVKQYGRYHPNGLGDRVDGFGDISKSFMEQYRNKPYMSMTVGFGGTIPHVCMNCGNSGLIDMGGLEGYKKAFESLCAREV